MKDMAMVNHVVPLIAPQVLSATTVSPHVGLKKYEKAQFILALGALDTADFTLTVTCSATTAGGTATALPFSYRLTAAAGTDTLGDVTAVANTGLALANASMDNKTVIVEVEGIDLTEDKPYVGLTLTRGGSATAYVSATAILKPRYPQETNDGALT